MMIVSPGFVPMDVVPLYPFPRTGERQQSYLPVPWRELPRCGPMSQALSPRCQPNPEDDGHPWVGIRSASPCLGWRARIAG